MSCFSILLRALVLVMAVIFVSAPLYWLIVVSIAPTFEFLYGQNLVPKNVTIKNFVSLFTGQWGPGLSYSFLLPLRNSIVVATVNALVAVVISAFAAYALVRMEFRFKGALTGFVLLAYVFPPFVLMVGLKNLLTTLRINNNLGTLILVHFMLTVPFCTWMLRSYFATIPKELEEAALVDGCTRIQSLFRITLPIAMPGVVSAATFAFTLSWQDFIFALVTLDSDKFFTMPLAIVNMVQGDFIQWGKIMAGALISAIPPIVIYYVLQRYVVAGLTGGAVKS